MTKRKQQEAVASSIRRRVPHRPGVYLFYDRHGALLYVGKSVDLRRRMLGYFHPHAMSHGSKTAILSFNIHGFDYRETESELHALLLEDELIKIHLPRFNVRQKQFLGYQYLELTGDRYPTLRPTGHGGNGGILLFGPFKDRFFLDNLLGLIHKHLHLRACREPNPTTLCLHHDIGHCPAPCRGRVSPAEYRRIVEDTRDFLAGDEAVVTESLSRAMKEASRARDFEKAAQLKARIDFCRRFCARQRFVSRFRVSRLVIEDRGANGTRYVFDRGCFGHYKESPATTDVRFTLDRANIVYDWIQRRGQSVVVRFD